MRSLDLTFQGWSIIIEKKSIKLWKEHERERETRPFEGSSHYSSIDLGAEDGTRPFVPNSKFPHSAPVPPFFNSMGNTTTI